MCERENAAHEISSVDVSDKRIHSSDVIRASAITERGWYTNTNLALNLSRPADVFSYAKCTAMRQNLSARFNEVQRVTSKPSAKRKAPRYFIHHFLNVIYDAELLSPQLSFVATVNALQFIMMAPYAKSHNSRIYAQKFQGIWFLSDCCSDEDLSQGLQKKYADYLFRILHTAGRRFDVEVRRAPQMYCRQTDAFRVLSAQVGTFQLLYSGNVHCHNGSELVQLLSKCKGDKTDDIKLLAWTYSYLMRLERVVIGTLHIEKGSILLHSEDSVATDNLSRQVLWSPEVCIASLNVVLNQLTRDNHLTEGIIYKLILDCEERRISIQIDYRVSGDSVRPFHLTR